MKGGKIIDQGTYGCVFKPALRCKGTTNRVGNTISKLLTEENAYEELKKHKMIDTIDPNFNFHLQTPTICDPGNFEPKIDNIEKCDIYNKQKKTNDKQDFKILNYPYGGISLRNYIYSFKQDIVLDNNIQTGENKLLELFMSMKQLISGFYKMHQNNIAHLDIKLDNVLIEQETNKINLIDFGLTQRYKDIENSSDIRSIFSSGYFVWPIEVFFLNQNFKNITPDTIKTIKSIYENSYSNTLIKRYLYPSSDNFYMKTLTPDLTEKYQKDINQNYRVFSQYVIEKIDVFSLGLLFVEMWCTLLNIWFVNDKKNQFIPDNVKYTTTLSMIHTLIMNMIQPYYKDRMSPKEVYEYFLQIETQYKREEEKISKEVKKKIDDTESIKKTKKKELTKKNGKNKTRKSLKTIEKRELMQKNIRYKDILQGINVEIKDVEIPSYFIRTILGLNIYLLYLIKKYSDSFCLIRDENNNISISYTYGKKEFDTFKDIFLMKQRIQKCRENNKRFVVLPLIIYLGNIGHQNIVIIDLMNNTLERFEPHGIKSIIGNKKEYVDDILQNMSNELNLQYLNPFMLCPKIDKVKKLNKKLNILLRIAKIFTGEKIYYQGFQAMETLSNISDIKKETGYCLGYSILYLNLRLENPDLKPWEITQNLLYQLQYNPENILKLIRNYVLFLNTFTKEYFTEYHRISNYSYGTPEFNKEMEKFSLGKDRVSSLSTEDMKKEMKILQFIEDKLFEYILGDYDNWYGFLRVVQHKEFDKHDIQWIIDNSNTLTNEIMDDINNPDFERGENSILISLLLSEDFASNIDIGLDAMKILVENGANVNIKNKYGNTPLNVALDFSAVSLLIENGADVNQKTPLIGFVKQTIYTTMEDEIEELIKIIKLLIENGADVNIPDNRGNTALMILLNEMPDDNNDNNDSNRPYLIELANILINAGADLSIQNNNGIKPSDMLYKIN